MTAGGAGCAASQLARLVFLVGRVALTQLVHVEQSAAKLQAQRAAAEKALAEAASGGPGEGPHRQSHVQGLGPLTPHVRGSGLGHSAHAHGRAVGCVQRLLCMLQPILQCASGCCRGRQQLSWVQVQLLCPGSASQLACVWFMRLRDPGAGRVWFWPHKCTGGP